MVLTLESVIFYKKQISVMFNESYLKMTERDLLLYG